MTGPTDAGAQPDTFSIMFVCTGNMCRSPMGERMAMTALRRGLGSASERFRVYSGGTGTMDGRMMTPETIRVVMAYGGDPGGFRSSEITVAAIQSADLVLTATRAHRSDVVTMEPSALRRCFTMTEFARTASAVIAAGAATGAGTTAADVEAPHDDAAELGDDARLPDTADAAGSGDGALDAADALPTDPVERARVVVAAVARWRGTVRPQHPDDDDIPDPIGRPMEVYEASGKLIAQAVDDAVLALVGGRP